MGSVVSDWEKGAVPLQRKYMKLKDRKMILSILGLGLSGFIMCVTNSLSQIACNATLARWVEICMSVRLTILNSVREFSILRQTVWRKVQNRCLAIISEQRNMRGSGKEFLLRAV